MLLLFNKILPVFVLPTGLVIILLLYALWRKKRWPLVTALVLFFVSHLGITGNLLVGWLESRYPAIPVAAAGPADAVFVLGGILGPPVQPGYAPNWNDTSERFEAALALVQAGRAENLVFTGAFYPWEKDPTSEGDRLRQVAIARGINPKKIVVTGEIDNTATEARAAANLMKIRGWHRLILVTTAWHMPRAVYLFRKAGVDFVPFPVDYRTDPARSWSVLEFIPRADAGEMTELAVREFYGNLFYRIFW